MNVLSAMPVSSFCAAVDSGDVKALSRINGIGKRTAERLVVELKGRLEGSNPEVSAASAGGSAAADACAALEQLGFKRDAVNKAVNALLTELQENERTTENLLRKALVKLNCGK